MKKIFQTIIISASLLLATFAQAEPQSLRVIAIPDESAPSGEWHYIDDDQLVTRQFIRQPPLIPHAIEGYRISLRANKCLSCHAWDRYRKKKATKISLTHFRDREGKELSHVAATRYFCLQCHVPQVDRSALVENRFQPVKALISE
uniref:Periplasmic nitrate reductase, electron transfer subunit n=1 Tax=Candidatus Kentrum sp. DK TaxID=2126562 RepID=A0A450S746_9GAMM|nr:MAG: periplasmic nitrate reductase subunit NapB [Candidatus Kentron sp. DK]VFJ47705.1 MAG: periplasmic nitrate reductase subunit NapB [Candidatus Kentron sp. DK]